MKRIVTFVAIVAASLFLASKAQAQPGIIAGLTSSKSDMASAVDNAKSIALYHAGLTYKIDLGAGFAIQPSLPVGIQWGPDLLAFRPYVFAEPFIGYQITSSDSVDTFSDWTKQAKNKFEYGFGLGGGLEVASHIQLSVQWFKNLGNMFGDNVASGEATWNKAKDFKNFQGIKVSLAILF